MKYLLTLGFIILLGVEPFVFKLVGALLIYLSYG